MATNTDTVNITEGVEVRFPYNPYDCQKAYMEIVIKAVKNCENALLESPTGTGKTLSLICSTLACLWHERTKDAGTFKIRKEGTASEAALLSTISTLRNTMTLGSKNAKEKRDSKLRIIYASRTHSQLKQVIREAKKSSYTKEFASKGLTAVVLGSRDQLCIHPGRGRLTGEALNAFCKKQVHSQGCMYHSGMKKNKGGNKIQFYEFMDIEELVALGKSQRCCPFFTTREAHEYADVTLLPYNYLFSPMSREAMEIQLKNTILIIDEAHNVESVAEAAAGFKISQIDIARYLHAVKRLASMHQRVMESSGPDSNKNSEITSLDLSTVTRSAKKLKKLDSCLAQLSLSTKAQKKPPNMQDISFWRVDNVKRDNVVFKGSDMLGYLMRVMEFSELRTSKIEDAIKGCLGMLSAHVDEVADAYHSIYENTRKVQEDIQALSTLLSFFQHIFSKELQAYPEYFHVMITEDTRYSAKKQAGQDVNPSSEPTATSTGWKSKATFAASQKDGATQEAGIKGPVPKVISFECLQASPSFLRLKNDEVRSMILTSGTLSPLKSLEISIGGGKINFEHKLSNMHVVPRSNVCVFSIGGVEGSPNIFSSDYSTRNNAEYIKALGETLLTFLQTVPAGVLVFFGSYTTMENTVNTWKRMGLYGRMERAKTIFLESRGSAAQTTQAATENKDGPTYTTDSTQAQLKEYNELISEGRGCAFLGICRGKIAEGIDFTDDACRGVFICGLPYPNLYEDNVALKMDYLRRSKAQDSNVDDERAWYNAQAIRAVNQAIGRAIRHINDYGVIMLADRRFSMPNVRNELSKWVLSDLKERSNIKECMETLEQFLSQFRPQTSTNCYMLNKKIHTACNVFQPIIDSLSHKSSKKQVDDDDDLNFKRRRLGKFEEHSAFTALKNGAQIFAVSYGFKSKPAIKFNAFTEPQQSSQYSQETEASPSGWEVMESWSNSNGTKTLKFNKDK